MTEVKILHLTDIHAGKGELADEDGKTGIPKAERLKQLERLSGYLAAMPKPDFVVVSGDISIRGDRGGLERFKAWLEREINNGVLPGPERFLLVPGNHDVTRRKRQAEPESVRFAAFSEIFGNSFPHAHIPGHDPSLCIPAATELGSSGLFGGISTSTSLGLVILEKSQPFILDIDCEVLIFGFNSAHACGVPLPPDPKILGPLEAAVEILSGDLKEALIKAREAYLDSQVIDAGLLTDQQLDYFNKLMSMFRLYLGSKFDRLTKIAVLHHHIGHLWEQQLETRQFEATVDAAQLKQALTEHGFDLVLHGHKHTNHVGLDGSLIPVDRAKRFSPLCIVSGGTIAGHPRLNDTQSFKLITLAGSKGPRTRAQVRQVPLKPAANPAVIIANEEKIFNVPLSSRLPDLHAVQPLKERLDADLLERLAPELAAANGQKAERVLLTNDASKFAPSLRYRCHSSLEHDGKRLFYEIIQATQKLGFGVISRVHWLVSDAASPCANGATTAVVLLIGNLENTHFSEALSDGEVSRSIDELCVGLEPAIASGQVEVRRYAYCQHEVMKINLEIIK